jgi:hypothetical protein
MTLNELKKMVDRLVDEGHGDKDLLMDTDDDVYFDVEFIEFREREDGTPYVGVRTNDNH